MQKHLYKWMAFLLCFTINKTLAQTNIIDSLKQAYTKASDTESKLQSLLTLCEYHQSIQRDSLYQYAIVAGNLAKITNDKIDIGRAAIILANAYLRLGKIDSAETIVTNNLPLYDVKEPETRKLFFAFSALQVDCFGERTNYEDALAALYKIINLAEQYQDQEVLAKNMSTIGVINYNLDHVPEAFSWYFKGLSHCQDMPAFYSPTTVLYINLAETYRWVEKTDSAFFYINKAIPLCEKAGNLFYLANALRVKAGTYKTEKKFELAEKTMLECIAIRQKTEGVLPLSNEQVALASIYMNWGKLDKAIYELTKALALSDSSNTNKKTSKAGSEVDVLKISYYNTLAKCYKEKGDDKNYTLTLEKIITAKDAFYEANSASTLAELQTKYELQKKETTINKQKLDITQKNYLFYGSLIVAALILLILWLLFKNYNRKQSIKMQFALQEEKRIGAQSIIDAEETERKRIAADLHDNIGAYASAIRADVEMLADKQFKNSDQALQNLQRHSQEIINSLRDTIWVLNKENITITGISDRIKNYINKLQPSYPAIQFNINESIENDTRISSQHALNIFRIIQEAIHNALKHSGANTILVSISSKKDVLIQVTDNGKGIDSSNNTDGSGLLNMHARAKEAGMKLSVSSATDEGTSLLLQTNTTN